MASAIDSIYDWVAALTPTPSSDTTVRCRDRDQLRDQLHTDDLPMRMLLVPDATMRGDFAFVALGRTAKITWTIVDRLFWRVASQGQGLQEYSDNLIKYIKSYVAAVQADRSPTNQSDVSGLAFIPRYAEWPTGSGVWFVCVDAILTIEEVMS